MARRWIEIYLIAEETDWVKIGISANSRKRLGSIQNGNPRRLELVIALPVLAKRAVAVESRAHYFLRKFERRGEWFKVDRQTALAAIGRARSRFAFSHGPNPVSPPPVLARHDSPPTLLAPP